MFDFDFDDMPGAGDRRDARFERAERHLRRHAERSHRGHGRGHGRPMDLDDIQRLRQALGGAFGPGAAGAPFDFGGPGGGRGRGGRRRRRGDVRLGALLLIAEEPRNGYAVIKELAERSGGAWTPSSGAVYPALAQLEDEGLIEPAEESGRKHYRITDAGRAEVEAFGDRDRPWDEAGAEAGRRMGGSGELWEAFAAVAVAARAVASVGDAGVAERATEELRATRRRLYGLLANDDAGDGAGPDDDGPRD